MATGRVFLSPDLDDFDPRNSGVPVSDLDFLSVGDI